MPIGPNSTGDPTDVQYIYGYRDWQFYVNMTTSENMPDLHPTGDANVSMSYSTYIEPSFWNMNFTDEASLLWNETVNITYTQNLFEQMFENFRMGTFGEM